MSGPTHQAGNCLDLVLSDAPDVVIVEVKAPLGSSDHSSISIQLNLRQSVPLYTVTKDVYLKTRVSWNSVGGEVSNIHLGTILRNSDPMSLLNDEILAIISRSPGQQNLLPLQR